MSESYISEIVNKAKKLKEIKEFVKNNFKKTEILYLTQKITMDRNLYDILSKRNLFEEMFCELKKEIYIENYERLRRLRNKGFLEVYSVKGKDDRLYFILNKLVVLKEKFHRTFVTLKVVLIDEKVKTYYLIFGKKKKK